MPVQVNIRHLEAKEVHLQGELPAADLDLGPGDELVRPRHPLHYDLMVQRIGQAVLAQGHLEMVLDCECARCLKPFEHRIDLENWTAHLALEGEEKAPVHDDLVDLTPAIREDILLELPQHPLCEADCAGLPNRTKEKTKAAGRPVESSAWSALNKLKF